MCVMHTGLVGGMVSEIIDCGEDHCVGVFKCLFCVCVAFIHSGGKIHKKRHTHTSYKKSYHVA